jgi:hypothetical protein
MVEIIKPITVLIGTFICFFILQSFEKKKNDQIPESKIKIILTKLSIFAAVFIIFLVLVYWFDVTSLLNNIELFNKTKINNNVDAEDLEDIPLNILKQNYAEVETIKKIRENINVGLSPDSMSIGEISRK